MAMALIKSLIRVTLVTGLILLVLLLAMQSSHDMVWDLFDFVVAGALLFSTGFAFELIAKQQGTTAYRVAAGMALVTALLLVWTNLAVGLIGSENNPANLLYGGVLAVGLVGAIIARFQPRGMVRTMFATALVQFLVPVVALLIWKPQLTSGVAKVFAANGLFVVLWIGAAMLFRYASTTGSNQSPRLA